MNPDSFDSQDMARMLDAMRVLSGELALSALPLAIAHTVCEQVGAGRCRVLFPDGVEAELVVACEAPAAQPLLLELLHGGEVLGALQLMPMTPATRFTARQNKLAGWIAAQAAQAVANALAHARLQRESRQLAHAEHAMRLAQADLARVSRATTVGQLTASIAHEINQPLMSIVSNAGASLRWLDRDVPELEHARAGLRDIIAEGRRAGGMIASLSALTRNTEPVFGRLDLNGIINHILAISRSELERRDVELQLALMPEAAWVWGDTVQLQQVMLNLVVNAIEAMAGVQQRARVLSISVVDTDDGHIMVHVADTGEGIAPSALPRIFDAFYTTKENGMGMGLAICRSIIETHHGRLTAEAAAPWGSLFSVVLPRQA